MILLIFLSALVVATYVTLGFGLGWEKGIQAASIVASSLAALALAFFGWRQMAESKQQEAIKETADLISLRNTIWALISLCTSEWEQADTLNDKQKVQWYAAVQSLLNSQSANHALLADQDSMAYWHNAIARFQFPQVIPFNVAVSATRKDIMEVWQKLILSSDKPLTGGRPKSDKPHK